MKIFLFMTSIIMVNTISAQSTDSINFICGKSTIKYAGRTYHTVKIGDQCWLKENLNVGKMIPGSQKQTNNGVIEKYCYDDNIMYCSTYGGLYQWDEAMQYSSKEGAQGICPSGWHIPYMSEFQSLSLIVNHDGNALKEIGQGVGDGEGTDTSGFSALIVPILDWEGYVYYLRGCPVFWSSMEYHQLFFTSHYAHIMFLYGNGSGIDFGHDDKEYGFSVRCLKDSVALK